MDGKDPANDKSLEQSTDDGSSKPDPKDYVARADYDRLLSEARTSKEKAEILDALMDDPDFQTYLNSEGPVSSTPATKPPASRSEASSTKELIESTLKELVKPLVDDIASMKEVYMTDKRSNWEAEASAQVAAMQKDTVNFPFFKEVWEEMADLLEKGEATNLANAYRIAAFGKAEAQGRNKASDKQKKGLASIGPSASDSGRRDTRPKDRMGSGKQTLSHALEAAFDKVEGRRGASTKTTTMKEIDRWQLTE